MSVSIRKMRLPVNNLTVTVDVNGQQFAFANYGNLNLLLNSDEIPIFDLNTPLQNLEACEFLYQSGKQFEVQNMITPVEFVEIFIFVVY